MFLIRSFFVASAALVILPSAEGLLEAIAVVEDTLSTYLALGASAIVLSELSPIFGGIASQEGQLQLSRVLVAITLGGWGATSLLYLVGRLKWEWLRRRFPSTRSAGTVALRIVKRNPARASFIVRFLFGARILLPIACGAAQVPLRVYLPMSLLGSFAWTTTFVLIGVAAGEAAEQMLGRLESLETIVTALGAALLVAAVVWFVRRRARRAERRAERRATPRTAAPQAVPPVAARQPVSAPLDAATPVEATSPPDP